MKRMVVSLDRMFKPHVRAYLIDHCIPFTMSFDIFVGVVCFSVPHAAGVRLLSELRRSSIPYELI